MSNELKSYLANVKYEIETSDIELEKLDLGLNAIFWNELLDYIINLQEKSENYRKLKERYQLEKELYKQRNEKAIEYINKLSNKPNVFGHYGIDGNCKKYLLNILKGDKDE